jgi:hypothetical protein
VLAQISDLVLEPLSGGIDRRRIGVDVSGRAQRSLNSDIGAYNEDDHDGCMVSP